jgi:hypothetical protein
MKSIIDPISTDEFGFYKLYFTIYNVKINSILTDRAIDLYSFLCAGELNILNTKKHKYVLAEKLGVKLPRIYKLMEELEYNQLIIKVETGYEFPQEIDSLRKAIKYFIKNEETEFKYEMNFKITNNAD